MRRWVMMGIFLMASVVRAADAPLNPKQQVLWDHLRLAIAQVEQGLDGVMGVAILDLALISPGNGGAR